MNARTIVCGYLSALALTAVLGVARPAQAQAPIGPEVSGPNYAVTYVSSGAESVFLQEKVGAGGTWQAVPGSQVSTVTFANKPLGDYFYRKVEVVATGYDMYYDQWTYEVYYSAQTKVTVLAAPAPLPLVEQQIYAARQGDLEGDGDIDLYVKRIAGTAWNLPAAELVLRKNANGTFNVETTVSQATRNIVNNWGGPSPVGSKLVDFNADGYLDILLTGLSPANVGPYDVVVFAANGLGAPPPSARLMDESIRRFASDTLANLHNPSYFASGSYQVCTVQWAWLQAPVWDIDGSSTVS